MDKNRKSIFEIYRTELMGLGALLVVLCHWSYMLNLGNLPVTGLVEQLGRGGAAVYLFMFLSGIGLYYSCANTKRRVRDFYRRCFIRVIIPYLMIMGIWYVIEAVLQQESILTFLYHWSTLSYWIDHKGAWFICALIPIYLVYPFWYRFSEKENRSWRYFLSFFIYIGLLLFLYNIIPEVFERQQNVWMSVLFFMLGSFAGESIRQRKSDCFWIIPLAAFSFLLQRINILAKWFPVNQLSYGFQGICFGLIYIGCIMVAKKVRLNCIVKWISYFFSKLGKYSLEIYLMNVALMDLVRILIQKTVMHTWWYIPIAIISITGGIIAGRWIQQGIRFMGMHFGKSS